MSYERLNIQDFVDKWDVAKVQHLEDGIIANEEAIERYHNDSVVEVQADWTQNDPTAKDYVKNRTHYKEKEYSEPIFTNYEITPVWIKIDDAEYGGYWEFSPKTITLNSNVLFYQDATYELTINGVKYESPMYKNFTLCYPSIDIQITGNLIEGYIGTFIPKYRTPDEFEYEADVPIQLQQLTPYHIITIKLPMEYLLVDDRIDPFAGGLASGAAVYNALPKKYTDLQELPCYHLPDTYDISCLNNKDAEEYEGYIDGSSPIFLASNMWLHRPRFQQQCKVYFGGKVYSCVVEQDSIQEWYGIIGNGYIYDQNYINSGEPFCLRINMDLEDLSGNLYFTSDYNDYYSTTNGNKGGYFRVDILTQEEELVQLDEKFIPNTVLRKGQLNWDSVGVVQSYQYLGSSTEDTQFISCDLKIGSTIDFKQYRRSYYDDTEDILLTSETWTIDDTYTYSGTIVTASYNTETKELQFRAKYTEMCYVEASTPETYNIIDKKYLPQTSDWLDNDETSAGYIKNKTHYYIPPVTQDSLDHTMEFSELETYTYMITGEASQGPSFSGKFEVYVNGEYQGEFKDRYMSFTINDNIYYLTEESGANDESPYEGCWALVLRRSHSDTAESVHLVLKKIIADQILQQLDEKFIPDTIARAPKAILEDIVEAPTAEQYNAILQVLRDAGILATN